MLRSAAAFYVSARFSVRKPRSRPGVHQIVHLHSDGEGERRRVAKRTTTTTDVRANNETQFHLSWLTRNGARDEHGYGSNAATIDPRIMVAVLLFSGRIIIGGALMSSPVVSQRQTKPDQKQTAPDPALE